MQPTQSLPPPGPVRKAIFDAGSAMLQYAIGEMARRDPVRFGAPPTAPLHAPEDPRISYAKIHGCPWCQINLRLAGVQYALTRALVFPPGYVAYIQIARTELLNVRAMITANPGEIVALENPIGQIQLRLLAEDPDVQDVIREVAHVMDIATRAAETPSAQLPVRSVPPANVTGERVYGSPSQPTNGGSTDPLVDYAHGAGGSVRDAGTSKAKR